MNLQHWLSYFEENQQNRLSFSEDPHEMTEAERRRITKSIQSFQLGETSEGNTLRAQAKALGEEIGEPRYLKAIECLIREENRHSAYLARFMKLHSIPKARKTWNDMCFRLLRRLAGAEFSCRVLVTAEVVAMTYYDCLQIATGSPVLRDICRRLCAEEKEHVKFQMQQIHEIGLLRHALLESGANIVHFALMFATLVPVWLEHKEVLRMKYGFHEFAGQVWRDFREAMADGQESAARSLIEAGCLRKDSLCT